MPPTDPTTSNNDFEYQGQPFTFEEFEAAFEERNAFALRTVVLTASGGIPLPNMKTTRLRRFIRSCLYGGSKGYRDSLLCTNRL